MIVQCNICHRETVQTAVKQKHYAYNLLCPECLLLTKQQKQPADRRQLHPSSLCYAVASKCNRAAAEWNAFTSGMKWSVFIRRRSASYGGTSKQGFRSLVKMWRKPSVLVKSFYWHKSVKWSLAASLFFLPEFRAKKWGGSYCFRSLSLQEKVQLSFMQMQLTA